MKPRMDWSSFKLPLAILAAFVVLALWVGGGRILFGVFGWMAFITLFAFAPLIALYGIVLAIIAAIRQRTYRYRKRGPFMIWMSITLVALFCVGFFMPDAGDTKDSAGSALSVILLDRTNDALIGVSGTIAALAVFVTLIGATGAFLMVFFERPKEGSVTDS